MRSVFSVVTAVVVMTTLTSMSSHACGDKYIVQGRSQKFAMIHAPAKPSRILILRTNSKGIALIDRGVEDILRKVGHTVFECSGDRECETVLATAQFDVVVADLSDVAHVREIVSKRTPTPAILPVTFQASRDELSSAKKQYRLVFNAPSRPSRFLAAIDGILSFTN